MITTRMFSFVIAVLITALLLYVVTYSVPVPQPMQAADGTVTRTQSTPD